MYEVWLSINALGQTVVYNVWLPMSRLGPDSKPAAGRVKLFFAYVNLNLWINASQRLAQLVNLVVFASQG